MSYKKGELLLVVARGYYWHCFAVGDVVKFIKMSHKDRDVTVRALDNETYQTLSSNALVSIKTLTKLERAFYGVK